MTGFTGNVSTVKVYGSGIRHRQTGDNLKQCRFSGTADTQQADQFTFFQMNIDIADDDPPIIGFGDVFSPEYFHNFSPAGGIRW